MLTTGYYELIILLKHLTYELQTLIIKFNGDNSTTEMVQEPVYSKFSNDKQFTDVNSYER